MNIVIEKEELFNLIKMAVKEALEEEFLERFLKHVPYVSDEEMRDILEIYGTPSKERKSAYIETIEL